MKQFKQLVQELPAKKVVFTFGRFQPPTTGHGLLVAAVKHIADKQDADHIIYASKTQDKKSNPLPVDRKVYYLKRMFPGANFTAASADVPTFIQAVKQLNKKYKNIVMVAGSDRVAEYQKLLNKYNGKDFHYDSIEVVSAGERDPDAEGASGMSGTKMREAAKKGDFNLFKKGLPKTLSTIDGKRLMNEIREGMGLEQLKEKVELPKDDIREAYHRGDIYNVGDVVESNGQVYMIEKRGSNHLLLREQSGALVNKWLQDVQQSDKEFVLEGTLQEMKYTSADKIKVARVIAGALGVEDTDKSSNPELLINNGLRKVRSKPMRPEYVDVLHNMLQTARDAGIKFDEKLVPQKVTEGTKQPNGTDKVGDAAAVLSELSPDTLKSYIPKAMGSKSAADFTRGVKMAQGSGGEEELRKKSEKRSAGIHTAIKKLTKEELQEAEYWKNKSWQKKMSDAAKKERQAREKKEAEQVKEDLDESRGQADKHWDDAEAYLAKAKKHKEGTEQYHGHMSAHFDSKSQYHSELGQYHAADKASEKAEEHHEKMLKASGIHKEEVELEEGKMGDLHAEIGRHLDKHIDDFKSGHTGMDQFGKKVMDAHKKVAQSTGLEHKHAVKHVNDYVDSKLNEEAITEWVVKHDGVPADHPDYAIKKQFHGKKDVINHLTKYKDSAEQRAEFLKKKGYQNVRIEEGKDYSVTVTHYADGKHTKHEYTVKNANDYRHAKHIAMQRHGKKIGTLKQGEQYGASNMDVKELNKESYNEISDLLEQIATAAMMGKDTQHLKKQLRIARGMKQPVNTSDVEAEEEPCASIETAIGHSMTAPHETDNIRKQKVRYATEAATTAGEMIGEKSKKTKADLDEDQATAEYKVKTYYDNALGKTVTRKIRPHRVTFAASKKNAEPEVDQPGEAIKNEEFPGTDMSVVAKKDKKVNEGIVGMPAGDMGSMPIGQPEPFAGDPAIISPDAKKKLKDKKALNLKENEDEEDHEEDHDDLSTESDLDDMASEVQDLDDIIDAYDEDELVLVDDEGKEVEEDEDEKEVNEEALNEVLSRMERMKAKIRFAQSKSKRERRIKIAIKTPSSMKTLNNRARKLAVKIMKQRLARKPLNKLSVSEKERIEKVVQKRKKILDRLAMKLVSRVKKIEQARLHRGK